MPRYMTLIRIEEGAVRFEDADAGFMDRMNALMEELTKAGVLLDTAGLKPTAEATRVTWSGGRIGYTDGPFTETKEVVGGYLLIQAKDMAEALEWTRRFLELHPPVWNVTCEVRELDQG
ncbi:YciI family protein [Streptomyces antimicrobicus]|uniref:YciI family protein n=1 Tax=Streptomyces antimicrobicus TaxID=2883108 RepID=A0ABS8B984_9ACTN|nr:YciI family protein [Streptomyces antimicrobicus]MCB5181174.1 YciI family protein [Streptomyces antimicrobicus]